MARRCVSSLQKRDLSESMPRPRGFLAASHAPRVTAYRSPGRTDLLTLGPNLIVCPAKSSTMNAIPNATDGETRFSGVIKQASQGRNILVTRDGLEVSGLTPDPGVPKHHRDTLDRLAVAQAHASWLVAVTRDPEDCHV